MKNQFRILDVDDNRDVAEMTAALLAGAGYACACAFDGREAVAAADAGKPHLVLLDINMPQVSGYDVARSLRDHTRAPRPVMIAVTGSLEPSSKVAAKMVGFDHYLTKPVEPQALLELVARIAARAS